MLELVPLSHELLVALFERRASDAERMLDARLPSDDLFGDQPWVRLRIQQASADPSWIPWLLRGVIRCHDRRLVGHVGFHGPPGSHPLESEWPGVVELGYTIEREQRGHGYATQATAQLLAWAHTQGVRRVVLSISPDNLASLRVATKLGFRLERSYTHEQRGIEKLLMKTLEIH